MVDQLAWDDLPIARKSVLPGRGFFETGDRPPVIEGDALADAEVLAIADTDADGLTAVALVGEAHGDATLVPTDPHALESTLELVAQGIDELSHVYVLDLCPEAFDPIAEQLARLVEAAEHVRWFDHHQWDETVVTSVEDAGVELAIGPSDEVCTADVAYRELDHTFEDGWEELVAVVRDHDLWVRDDPRSDDIADLAHWMDPEEFIETVRTHGIDLPSEARELLTERREEKEALIESAVARAEYRTVGDITIGIAYGRCSQNEVAEAMRQGGADAAVVIKPSGGISLRGTDGFERCHEVARRLGGGGHPRAAGCKPDIFDDMLDFAHHWTTHGASARHAVLGAFRDVLVEDPEGDQESSA